MMVPENPSLHFGKFRWCSQNGLSEKELTTVSDVNYPQLTHAGDEHGSHYDRIETKLQAYTPT